MKAFLLAAGLGTRLRPHTNELPKCMLPVNGTPLLGIWLDKLASAGVSEVLVNLHYRADIVRSYLAGWTASPAVHTTYEPRLLGSAGTLLANKDWIGNEEFFLAVNADNLTTFDIAELIDVQREYRPLATLTAFRSPSPSAGGVLEVNAARTLTGFTEKPEHPVSDLVNAGIYAFTPDVLDEIDSRLPKDIGHDLLPRLVGRSRVIEIESYFRDIGTPEGYRLAQEEWTAR